MKKIICIFLVIMTLLILFVGCKSDSNNNNEESSQIDTTPQVYKCEHLWEQWAVITEATCEKTGKKQRGCHNCEESQTEEIAKLKHKESDWIIDKIASSTQKGEKHTECVFCKKQMKLETIPFVEENHIHKAVESIVNKKPDCVNNGVKYYICSCGYTVKTESIKALGHTVLTDAGVASNCTSSGLTEGSHCSVCNVILVKQQVIAAKGHTMRQETKSDSSSGESYILHYCANCAYSYKEELPTGDKIIYDANGIAYTEDENGDLWVSGMGKCTSNDITIPGSIDNKKVIGLDVSCFINNAQLSSVTISEGITEIKESAFFNCKNLTSVNLPSTVKRIEARSFFETNLKDIALPEGLEFIGDSVFYNAGLNKKIVVPDSVKNIGKHAFSQTDIEEIIIPGNATLGSSVFKQCESLKKVTIKDGLKQIPSQAFYKCKELEEINFPDSITYYGNNAFYGCAKLKISHLVIKNTSALNAFYGRRIDVLEIYSNIGESAFDSVSIGKLIVHEGVTEIGKSAFEDCYIEEMQLPMSLENVGSYAFYRCNFKNNDIVFKGAVKLNHSAFKSSSITSIKLPDGSDFGPYVFDDCDKLQKLTYGGTMSKWSFIKQHLGYVAADFKLINSITVICSDGIINPS